MTELLVTFEDIFEEPKELPPFRQGHDHQITVMKGALSTKLLHNLVGLDSCALEATQIDDCESLQPFEMVIGISAELLAYFSAPKLFVRMSPWSKEVIDSICELPFVLPCFMKSSTASFVCMAENLVFDPGRFKTTDLEFLVALGAHDLFVELSQRNALWSTMTDWTFLLDNVLDFTVVRFSYDRGKYRLFMSSKDASKGLLMEFLGLGFHLDSLGLMGSLIALSHSRNWCPFELALLAVFSCFLCCILLHTGVELTLLIVAVIFYLLPTTKSGWWLCAFSCYCRRMVKRQMRAATQVLVKRRFLPVHESSWEYLEDLQAKFPKFQP